MKSPTTDKTCNISRRSDDSTHNGMKYNNSKSLTIFDRKIHKSERPNPIISMFRL